MALGFSIGLGLLVFAGLMRVGVGAIDWLDANTSDISTEEARRRAHLAARGEWPPALKPFLPTPRVTIGCIIGLLLLTWLCRLMLQSPR